jgi:branched-chain amino acid transport system permease protein
MNVRRAKTCLLAALVLCSGATLLQRWFNPYWLFISYDIGINLILAVSLNLINGYTGQFSLGHAGFMAVGAYTAAVITNQVGSFAPWVTAIVFPLALLAGGLAAALAGLLVGIPTLRLRGDYLAIVTLGFGEIIRVLLQNLDAVGGARGYSVLHGWTNLFWAFGLAAVTVYVIAALVNSTYGRGFIAVHDDEIAAEAMGINTTKYKVTAFVVGAFFAGLAGGLYAHSKQYLTPGGFGFMQSIAFVVMVILGGMGNTVGVILAAVLLTLLPEGLRFVAEVPRLPGLAADHPLAWVADTRMIIYSLLLIVLMLARPQGLFGRQTRAPRATAAR